MTGLLPFGFFGGSPGPGELIVVFLVILLLFGPKRLPEITRTIGKVLAQLRRASYDFREQIMDIDEPPVHDIPVATDTDAGSGPEAAVGGTAGAEREADAPPAGDGRESV